MTGESPKMFRVGDSTDKVKAFRVSKDAAIAAVVTGNDEIHIYRLFDAKGEFLGDKKPLAPVQRLKIKDPEFSDVIDLQIHRKSDGPMGSQAEYFVYVVSTNGVLLYSQVEKKDDCKTITDDWQQFNLTPNCSDLNSEGKLIVDASTSKI